MKVWTIAVAAIALAACSQPTATTKAATEPAHQEQVASLPAECPNTPPAGGFVALDCRVAHGADNYMVHYAAEPADAKTGEVTVEAGSQQVKESVSDYYAPDIKDVDGDGADDILFTTEGGAANATWAFWRNVNGQYVRIGELNGTNITHTADGLLAVPAHSSAAETDISLYLVGAAALTPVLTLEVVAGADDQGRVTHVTCTVSDAPGLASLHLSRAQAQAKYCADPVATGLFE